MRIEISKSEIYLEVERTTAYAGSKMGEYERVSATEDDKQQLERFWQESCNEVCAAFKKVLGEASQNGDSYSLELNVSTSFDQSLAESLRQAVMSYMVQSIISRWFVLANKEEAAGYRQSAAESLEDAKRKVFYKRPPQRPRF